MNPRQSDALKVGDRVVVSTRSPTLDGMRGTIIEASGRDGLRVELDTQPLGLPGKCLWFERLELVAEDEPS